MMEWIHAHTFAPCMNQVPGSRRLAQSELVYIFLRASGWVFLILVWFLKICKMWKFLPTSKFLAPDMISDKLQELIISYLGPEKLVGTFFHRAEHCHYKHKITLISGGGMRGLIYCACPRGEHAQFPMRSINVNFYLCCSEGNMIRKLFKYFVIKSYVVSVDPVPTVNMVDE